MKFDLGSPTQKTENHGLVYLQQQGGGTQGKGVARCMPPNVKLGTSLGTQGAKEHGLETMEVRPSLRASPC